MTPEERDDLVAAVTTAHRDRDPHGNVRWHRSWHDLDAEGRLRAYEETLRLRTLEAAANAEGLSSAARAVLLRVRNA